MRYPHVFARLVIAVVVTAALRGSASSAQQAPIALPNTITSLAGGATGVASGSACVTDSSLTALDAFGDGCPGASAVFSSDLRGGVAVDPFGNVWVADSSNSAIRKIDARSGIITLAAGKGTACSSKTDSNGDGCPQSQTVFSSTPRGIGTDPWGNVFVAGYGSSLISVLCNATSPLCPNTTGKHLVGYMYSVAGCVATTSSAGTGGAGADGGIALPTGTCSTSVAELNQPRGVAADVYGNVFIADTANLRYRVVVGPATWNGVANPMASVISMNPTYSSVTAATAAGHIYPILGGATSPSSGAACYSGATVTALDALGDGCPAYVTSTNTSSSSAQGVAVDPAGDVVFVPASDLRVRVLYMGGTAMAHLITVNNPGVTPVVGYVYSIAGGGASTAPSSTPILGSAAKLDTSIFKVAVSSNGDIYIGDSAAVLYLDGATGYIRKLFASGAVCGSATDTVGDGCPASAATYGGSNGLGIALDAFNNLYMADTTNSRVREVAATTLIPSAMGSTASQTVVLHNSTTSSASTLPGTSEISLGSTTCGSVNADSTVECSVPVTFAPTKPGVRSTAVATTGALAGTLALSGVGSGPVLTSDIPNPTTGVYGAAITPAAIAISGSGNVYAVDSATGNYVQIHSDGSVTVLASGAPTGTVSLAVDSSETLYAVGSSSTTISTETLNSSGTYVAGSISYTPGTNPAAPRAVTVDANHTIYVYDLTNQSIYRFVNTALSSGAPTVMGTGYTSVVALALDPLANLYIADKGAQTLYRINPLGVQTSLATSFTPTSLSVDAGGAVYLQDAASGTLVVHTSNGLQTTLLSGLSQPSGVAVQANGDVISADAATAGVLAITRTSVSFGFGTSTSTTLTGTLGNAGNLAAPLFAQTDASDFALVAGVTKGCTFASTALGKGQGCTFSASFTPTGSGTGAVSDVLTLTPASSIGSLTLTGTKTGTAVTTMTTVTNQTPASPVYVPSATEVSFTVTVTPSSGSATGSVNVSIDGGTATAYALTSNAAAVPLSGLTAGAHTIQATYPSQGGIVGSTSTVSNFSIAQATTSLTWTPTMVSVPVSQALGTGVLNATSGSIPGAYVYTATPSGGPAISVDAASYLPIGTYALAVTFTPTDATDYSGSTGNVSSFSVVQASTTSTVGATTNLVAADGSGNYTTLSAAVAALPTAGGAIYIAPGTYTEQVSIAYPNVSLRGLGGDPTKVILTAEAGATPNAQNGGKTGDEGSSTLNVDKATINTTTYVPNNFYAEYMTVNNTWNTDTSVNPSALVSSGGSCVANTSNLSNNALYLAGTLCYPQALSVWTRSDQSVFNNVRLNSLQDTLYAGSQGSSGSSYTAARQYFWKGYITGDIDYVFGDAAMVFDQTQFYTQWHATTAGGGTETISAQNKAVANGSTNDYLSGYVMNACTLTSQSTGMTGLYFGRPYGQFSTNVLLNTKVDQVNPLGWLEFSGQTNLPTSTYAEYNSIPYTDAQGNTGQGVTGTRETTSIAPQVYTTAAQAAKWAPVTFLGQMANGTSWNPTTALAGYSNAFTPTTAISAHAGTSVTLLYRPQTPGAGVVPTGTYSIYDNGSLLISGTLDASGSAYYTTTSLPVGPNNLTVSYSGDSNFLGSTSASAYVVTITPSSKLTPVVGITATAGASYGQSVIANIAVSGTGVTPTGSVSFSVDGGTPASKNLTGGAASFTLSGLTAGAHSLSAVYTGDTVYSGGNGTGSVSLAKVVLQVTANSQTIAYGTSAATYTASYIGFVPPDTTSVLSGSPSLTTIPATPTAPGSYTITAVQGTLSATNYSFTFVNGTLTINAPPSTTAVATGDTRTVTEPSFPSVCMQLVAAIADTNGDIPSSVDATNTNPDGARIQAALNACTSGQAVELSAGNAGADAFLTGPLVMPSNVTLLIDPGVTMYGSRNAQDYDAVAGTHTCGTVNSNSATSSCKPLILINGVSNVGIMGYGKINGRGGDVVLNAFPASYAGQTWWGLATIANSGGNQQNPRMIQLGGNASNITMYKITLMNSTMFHVSTTSSVAGFTAWDVKIVTPTSSRNTDGIDPGNVNNFTVTRSYISDGDDNVAVGASGSNPATNISITNNHFYAGHGESIGSYTSGGVSNVLFDGNMLSGNASVDSNSTGIRIKSANDRGGVVTNIQYSNSCFQNHKALMQFTPLYNTNTGTLTPNFNNILLQNLTFLTEGTVQLTGSSNNGTVYPLGITFDNVGFTTLQASDLNGTAPSNTVVTLGPGQVSSNFVTAINADAGSNGVVVTDNRTVSTLLPPTCNFTYIAPELTGPNGANQSITQGQTATAVVILTPTVAAASYPYPTGMVTLTDSNGGGITTVTLPGSSDTVMVPLTGLAAGTHTFSASYSGDTTYVPAISGQPYVSFGSYQVVVNPGATSSTTTVLTGVPASVSYGTAFTATANVTGATTGNVEFVVNGVVASTSAIAGGAASVTLNLPVGAYSIVAQYLGAAGSAASASAPANVTVGAAATTTVVTASSKTTTVGVQIKFVATTTSTAGTPTGTVTFAASVNGGVASTVGSATLNNGTANASLNLPLGTDNVTATYIGSVNFGASTSTGVAITVNPPTVYPLSSAPIALPLTVSTVAGGATAANANTTCAGSTDANGNGCQATQMVFSGSSLDLRSVVADPFGNLYLTDANASEVRRITPDGTITLFAGYLSGTACLPAAGAPCNPTLVKLNKPRGVFADAFGNVFIAGYSDNKVYEVKVADGLMYLVAGSGSRPSDPTQTNGDGGAATAALINQPRGAAADSYGNIYIADTADNKIREVDTSGNIQTIIGTGISSSTGDSGLATAATVSNPQGVLVDPSDNVYVADAARVRVLCVTCASGSGLYNLLQKLGVSAPTNGYIYTIAGTGSSTYNYTAPALANTVDVAPQKLAMDASSNLYISDGSGVAWFVDAHTGYIRLLAGKGTSCNSSSIGDGCLGTQASFGTGTGGGIGVGVDLQGNAYISDTLNGRIRKIATNLMFPSTATGASTTQPVRLHLIAGDTLGTTSLPLVSTDFTLSSLTCVTNTDTTQDCSATATFTPTVAGPRGAAMPVTTAGSHTAVFSLGGIGSGSGATLDPATSTTIGTGMTPSLVAVDSQGNVYVADATSKKLLRFAAGATGASASSTVLATINNPTAITTDQRGNVYVADASGSVTQVSSTGASGSFGTFASPSALATDSANNLFVADSSTAMVYEVGANGIAQRTLIASGLTGPTAMAVAAPNALYVADAGTIYRYGYSSATPVVVSSAVAHPGAFAVDAAGNLLVTDKSAGTISAIPSSPNTVSFPVASGITASALAVDGNGNVYTANGSGGVVELLRTQAAASFKGTGILPATFTLLSTGSQPLSISSLTQTDSADYSVTAAAAADCTVSGGVPSAVVMGGGCALTATYAPTTFTNTTDTVSFNGAGALQLVLTGTNTPLATTLVLGAPTPASPVLGQSVSVTATVAAAAGSPAGNVVFTVDGTAQSPIPIVAGSSTATLTGLAAGNHTVGASYTSSNNFLASSATAVSFVVKGTPALALSVAPAVTSGSELQGIALTFTATLTASKSPVGTVSFYDGSTLLTSGVALSGSGVATYTTSALAVGAHSITAQFAGDSLNQTVTSTPVAFTTKAAVTAGITTSTPSLYLSVSAPGSTTATLSYAPNAGYAGTLQFSCVGLPAGVTCSFNPSTLTFTQSSTAAQTTTLTIAVAAVHGMLQHGPGDGRPIYYALLLPGLLGLWRQRKKYKLASRLLLLALIFGGFVSLTGCGNGSSVSSSTFSVVATDGTNSISTLVNLTIH
ncbi:Pectinesterase [Bryocella elongata]|uniref:Pectinesterase n=1 Tax=Bryocella elongata TaxID=863522 RepID=A0A1H5TBU2_9BACT|nr:pectinesterase family protein [Bryocella elongata]SEF60312.1 Pectinesterase [Bryocella elongata]